MRARDAPLQREELIPLGSRIRTRLATGVATRDELLACLDHLLGTAGNAGLMTKELRQTLCDHAAGNYRMTLRRRTIEHVFGTLKNWMGSTHFLTRRLENVGTEMSLLVLAYNLKHVIKVLGHHQNDESG